MFSLPEIVVLSGLGLVVLGPKKMAEVSGKLGRAYAEFKRAKAGFTAQISAELQESAPAIAPKGCTPAVATAEAYSSAATLARADAASALQPAESAILLSSSKGTQE